MCDSRDEKFVIPIKPAAGMGWWLGQVLDTSGRFYRINILWVEVPECQCSVIHSTEKYVREFENISEAINHLASEGAIVSALV